MSDDGVVGDCIVSSQGVTGYREHSFVASLEEERDSSSGSSSELLDSRGPNKTTAPLGTGSGGHQRVFQSRIEDQVSSKEDRLSWLRFGAHFLLQSDQHQLFGH